MRNYLLSAAIVCSAFFAGCSGGGGSIPPSPPPGPSASVTHPLTLSLIVPRTSSGVLTQSAKQHLEYISAATQSFVVRVYGDTSHPSVNGVFTPSYILLDTIALNVSTCPTNAGAAVCTTTIKPPGDRPYLAFQVVAYGGPNSTGPVLSYGSAGGASNIADFASLAGGGTVFYQVGLDTTVSLSLGGVPATYSLAQSNPLTDNVAGSAILTLQGYDSANNLIINPSLFYAGPNGGGAFVSFTIPSASSSLTLTKQDIAPPNQFNNGTTTPGTACSFDVSNSLNISGPQACVITLNYDGKSSLGSNGQIILSSVYERVPANNGSLMQTLGSRLNFTPVKQGCATQLSTLIFPAVSTPVNSPQTNGAPC